MKKLLSITCVCLISLMAHFPAPSHAGVEAFYTSFASNVAVQGYDPVSYFTQSKPIEGSKEFATEYKGAKFLFSNAENLNAFKADPEKYAPQYGGYCAWAVSQGYTAKGDAKSWKIVDGKLYLNYSASVQKTWESDIAGFITKADKNWPNLKGN
jgi:YHS domain-containing protein